jgi:putative CocE/NonD family hydrolase
MVSRRQFLEQAGIAAGAGALAAYRTTPETLGLTGPASSQAVFAIKQVKTFIPMKDGTRLACNLVMPEGAASDAKFPAILVYNPYRGAEGDSTSTFRYYAERGYVGARVDVRGTGASEGRTTPNEYSEQEGQDALEIIAWLASQPWSSGKVGMMGSSYSGFNSIQIAMLRPPALAAIVPDVATDDVYTDDIVYYDGVLQFESLGRWPFSMIATMGLPASPDYNPDTPEAQYRVEQEPWIFEMLRHQRNDAFWQRMSLRPNYDAIQIPTLMLGGWLDAYTDSIPRMLDRMKVPTKAIMGQWTHAIGQPGPPFFMPAEIIKWWDRWLKGIDNGVLKEPRVATWINQSYKPSLTIKEIPGSWRYEDSIPPVRVREQTWYPQPNAALSTTPAGKFTRCLDYKATVGMTNRYRCPHNSAELPIDQRTDDAFNMTFDSTPLEQEVEILGVPKAVLYVSATAPVAHWIVRLCDVHPDGTSTLVTKGILNGTHYRSHVTPEALEPGKVYEVPVNLKAISWRFPPGHRIRVSIGNADFPNLWPSPYRMTTTLHVDGATATRLVLPVCPSEKRPVPTFVPPPPPAAGARGPQNQWTVSRDEMAQTVTVFRETRNAAGGFERRWCTASDLDPARCKLVAEGEASRESNGRRLVVSTSMTIESDVKAFAIRTKRELRVDGTLKYSKEWSDTIPRDLL